MEDLQNEAVYRRVINRDTVDPMPPSLVPPRRTLHGQYVDLEPLCAHTHAEGLFAAGHSSDEALRIWEYLPYGPWNSVEEYRATLRAQSASFDPIFYVIRSRETAQICGQVSFLEIYPDHGGVEIGHIWFAPHLQRTQGATEALYLLLRHAMDDLGYRRMQWKCNAMNAGSRMAAVRLGFRFEGVFFNHLIVKGKNRDTAWYSILDSEWPDVRSAFDAWLEDANFQDDGRQRQSLTDLMQQRDG